MLRRLRSLRSWLWLGCVCGWLVRAAADAPPGYYAAAEGVAGPALRTALHQIVRGHAVVPYTSSSGNDTRAALRVLDEDPLDTTRVVLFYSGATDLKSAFGVSTGWNREHVWPASYGLGSGAAYSDLHNLRACDWNVNSARGNKWFDLALPGSAGFADPAHPEAPGCRANHAAWEPPAAFKGDVARIVFYMDVRYEGTAGEPHLQLTSDPAAVAAGAPFLGRLEVLRQWHLQDPPDAAERLRNDRVFTLYQGNRNPFVDRPEFVERLYGDGSSPGEPPPSSLVLAQWNFNGLVAGQAWAPPPSAGAGAAAAVGVGSAGFFSGAGSSDPATTGNQGWGFSGFPAQGTAPRRAGAEFTVATAGHSNVVLTFDFRATATASRQLAVLVSAAGEPFAEVARFQISTAATFINGLRVDLGAVPLAANRAATTVRLVSDFGPGGTYEGVSSGYQTGGTWRLDQVTFSAVPAPSAPADMAPVIATPDQGATAVVSWTTTPGYQYRVEASTDLQAWLVESEWRTADGHRLQHVSAVPGPKKFFRVQVR